MISLDPRHKFLHAWNSPLCWFFPDGNRSLRSFSEVTQNLRSIRADTNFMFAKTAEVSLHKGRNSVAEARPAHAGSEWFLLSCLCSFSLREPCRCRSIHLAWCCLTHGSETASIHYLRSSAWHVQLLQNTLTWIKGNLLWAEIPTGEFSL